MPVRPKTSYHPYVLVAFCLNCLPPELLNRIPRSTRHEWRHKDQVALYGYEWYLENKQLFGTLQEVAASKKLLLINRALLRVIALKRFMELYQDQIKGNIFQITEVVLNTIYKISEVIGCKATLKYLDGSYGWYLQLRRKLRCSSSLFS